MERSAGVVGAWVFVTSSWLAVGCGPSLGPGADGSGTSGDGSGTADGADETGDGGGQPQPECLEHPRDLQTPSYEWIQLPDASSPNLPRLVLPGGDLLFIEGGQLRRAAPDDSTRWVIDAAEDESFRTADVSSTGEIVVAGSVTVEEGETALWLLRLDADGNRMHEEINDHWPGDDRPIRVALPDAGGVLVELEWRSEQITYLHRYDDAFVQQWSVQVEDSFALQSVLGLDGDAEGNAYYGWMVVTDPGEVWPIHWEVHLDSYDAAGVLRWSFVEDVGAENTLVGGVSIGDWVYLLAGGPLTEPSYLWALDTGGTVQWSLETYGSEPYRSFNQIGASLCGGVYVVGEQEIAEGDARAALWHLGSDGAQNAAATVAEPGPVEQYVYDTGWRIQSSPGGDVVAWGVANAPGTELEPIPWMRGF